MGAFVLSPVRGVWDNKAPLNALLAQGLERWPVEPRQHGFKSRTERFGVVAQMVERQSCKLDVKGSNPFFSTRHVDVIAHFSAMLPLDVSVMGH